MSIFIDEYVILTSLSGVLTPEVTSITGSVDGSGVYNADAIRLHGRPIAPYVPEEGQALTWNSSTEQWEMEMLVSAESGGTVNAPITMGSGGDILYGDNMISGTGPIYAGDIYINGVPVCDTCTGTGGGTYIDNASSEDTSSTTSTSWQRKLRMSLAGLEAGTYKIEWYYEWNHNHTGSDYKGRIQLNDSTTIMEHRQKPKSAASTQWVGQSGFYYYNFSSGDHNIDLDYCSSQNNKVSKIRRARLDIWRVS